MSKVLLLLCFSSFFSSSCSVVPVSLFLLSLIFRLLRFLTTTKTMRMNEYYNIKHQQNGRSDFQRVCSVKFVFLLLLLLLFLYIFASSCSLLLLHLFFNYKKCIISKSKVNYNDNNSNNTVTMTAMQSQFNLDSRVEIISNL